MDILSRTVIDMLRLAATPPSPGDPLMVAPIEDMLPICFGQSLQPDEYATIASGLRSITFGRNDIASGLAALSEQLAPLRRRLAEDTGLSRQTSQTDEAIRDLLMLQRALFSTAQTRLALQPSLAMLQLIRQIQLRTASGDVVLCSLPASSERITVNFSKHSLLDRIELAYEPGSPYPLLTINTPSQGESAPFANMRTAWQQKDSADYTLELYNARSLVLGTIATAPLTLDGALEGDRVALHIAPDLPLRILETSIFDRNKQLLARSIGLFPLPA